ncbi:hypothetical protein HQ535_10455 [bacterium]|nr:hypothetical protein [bacterium]
MDRLLRWGIPMVLVTTLVVGAWLLIVANTEESPAVYSAPAAVTFETLPSSSTVTFLVAPPLTAAEGAHLRARAITRTYGHTSQPVCLEDSSSPEWRDAVSEVFPLPVEYFSGGWDQLLTDSGTYRCFVISVADIEVLRSDLVAVGIYGAGRPGAGRHVSHLFRWDGEGWVDTTAGEMGMTTTTRTS